MEETLEYLKSWLAWAEDPQAEDCKPYRKSWGLCGQSTDRVDGCLWELFREDGLSTAYPFTSAREYEGLAENDAQHLHEPRLEWVRKTIERLEKEYV